jgi:hypothetical protein
MRPRRCYNPKLDECLYLEIGKSYSADRSGVVKFSAGPKYCSYTGDKLPCEKENPEPYWDRWKGPDDFEKEN